MPVCSIEKDILSFSKKGEGKGLFLYRIHFWYELLFYPRAIRVRAVRITTHCVVEY